MTRVLIVEDEPLLASNIREKLEAAGHQVKVAHTCTDAIAANDAFSPDAIVLDLRLPDGDGLKLLPKLKEVSPACGVIVVTAHGNETIAVKAMKAGASDYLTKPIRLEELKLVVDRTLDRERIHENLTVLHNQEQARSGLDQIVGQSKCVRELKKSIRRLANTEALRLPNPPTVLITGETGTGKDLVARAIHYHGPRKANPFIRVNCTAIPGSLFESELFGHVRGAFTNASHAKRGLIEVAEGGTVFLDEIGHLEPDMQAKLLLAIERSEIRPVGATESRTVNVHIVAATNRNLDEAVENGDFRRDLYHRLHVIQIHLPPLRERSKDIPVLMAHFMKMHARRFGVVEKNVRDDALAILQQHGWPGNIRELSHFIENCLLQLDDPEINARNIPLVADQSYGKVRINSPDACVINLDFDENCPTFEEIERVILLAAYKHAGQNLSGAARLLGITREAFRYRLNRSAEKAR
ncbi:MAG: sigma-54-dependent transcriptional regulator [Phycisphaerae bacterium]